MDTDSPQLRLGILAITAVSLFGALFARLWYLQVMAAPTFQDVATQNRERVIYEEPRRGRILDRHGRVVVDNRTSLVLAVNVNDPSLAKPERKTALLRSVAQELTRVGKPTKVAGLERRLNDTQYNPLTPIPLAIDIPEELQIHVAEHPEDFPGVEVRRESVRAYPNGGIAAQVLGYVGRIGRSELTARQGTDAEPIDDPKHYQPDSPYGKAGIELVYENDLRGTPGVRRVEVDVKGRVVRTVEYVPPIPGNDVQLTLDTDLQKLAEDALSRQLDTVRGAYTTSGVRRAPAASIVLTDPRDGGVIAMASYPTYDPEEFVNGISSERYAAITGGKDSENPFINRAIAGQYAPASTFKLVTSYAALQSGMITAATSFGDPGFYNLRNCTTGATGCQKTNAENKANGTISLATALTVSSDVFFYNIGDTFYWEASKYGDGLQSAARSFGYGTDTGIDLPEEADGVVPDPAYRKRLYDAMSPEEQKNGSPVWVPGNTVDLSVGQGFTLATPLQIANAYATFANGGTLHQPRVAARVLKPAGDPSDPNAVVRSFDPKVTFTVPIPTSTAAPIRQGLLNVPEWRLQGTAGNAFQGFDTTTYPVIAKTGTAEVDRKADFAVFAGCGPDPRAELCVAIVMEEAGFGGEVAAPVARRIFDHASGQDELPDYEPWVPGFAVAVAGTN